MKAHNCLAAVGLACVIGGLYMLHPAAALIGGGVVLVSLGVGAYKMANKK